MSDSTLSITFWTLFHSMLREDKADAQELERVTANLTWLTSELHVLARYCTNEEAEIIGLVYAHWAKTHKAPSYTVLKHHLAQDSKTVLEEALKDYEETRDELPRLNRDDVIATFVRKQEEFQTDRLQKVLKNAMTINSIGVDQPDPTNREKKIKLKGPEAAIQYVVQRLDAGVGSVQGQTITHGTLQESTRMVEEVYRRNADPNRKAGKRILTGLQVLDSRCHIRRGHFVGLLGYAKNGKTRLGRTMLYNAACMGSNVMHFTMEQSFEEELIRYAVIHSHHPMWGKDRGINLTSFESGTLTRDQDDFLHHEVLPDIRDGKSIPGSIIIRQPTNGTSWEAIQAQIVIEDRIHPLEEVMVDYLAMCKVKGNNRQDAMNEIIDDVKNFAMTFRNNDGLAMITPVQGNRPGWNEASKNGGRWEPDGIYLYSGFEKALDLCLSVFEDDDLKADKKVVVSSCVHRRGENIPPTKLAVNHDCGTFHDLSLGGKVDEKTLDDALELI